MYNTIFDIHMYSETITTVSLINASFPHTVTFVCVESTFKLLSWQIPSVQHGLSNCIRYCTQCACASYVTAALDLWAASPHFLHPPAPDGHCAKPCVYEFDVYQIPHMKDTT